MRETKGIYRVKDNELIYTTDFTWLILNTPEVYKKEVAYNWLYGGSICSNGTLVKMLFTAENEYNYEEIACVQDVVTKRVYIIATSALELKEDKEKEEKSLLDRLRKNERNFLQGLVTGKRHCNTRECCNCILSYFPETSCEKLAKDLLEKLK